MYIYEVLDTSKNGTIWNGPVCALNVETIEIMFL